MEKTLSVAMAVVAVAGGAVANLTAQQTAGYAFVNANVITLQDEPSVLRAHTVLVLGDTIADVAPSAGFRVPNDVTVIDAAGRYLLPGLADMHIHLRHQSELASYVRYGVTTVLQMSEDSRTAPNIRELHRRLRDGTMIGPTMYWTGPLFSNARFTPRGAEPITAETIPSVLARHKAEGYDFIKVHNMVPVDVYRAIVDAKVLPVIGHIPVLVGPEETLRSGQRMIAHAELFYYSYFFDNSCLQNAPFWQCAASIHPDYDRIDDITRAVVESGVTVTANLSYVAADLRLTRNPDSVLADPEWAYLSPVAKAAWENDLPAGRSFPEYRRRDLEQRYPFVQALVKSFAEHGVPLLAGTDTFLPGLYPGAALHLELDEMVRAGLTPLDALRAATANAGRFIGDNVPGAERFGVIDPGARADLVLVDANPLTDVANLSRIHGVMVRGRWLSAAELERRRYPYR